MSEQASDFLALALASLLLGAVAFWIAQASRGGVL